MDIASNPGPHPNQRNNLRALYLNARSLKAIVTAEGSDRSKICKITILQQIVFSGDFDVVGVTETWLNNSVTDSEIIPGYSIFRRDREDRAGGVMIAVKGGIEVKRRPDLEKDGAELVVVDLKTGNVKTVTLYCFYHPDSSPEPLLELNSSLRKNTESACILLLGDFNLPELNWANDETTTTPVNNSSRADHKIFCDLVGDNFLYQTVPGPTHIAGNKLDFVLCNWPETIENVLTFHPREGIFPTDHYVIEFDIRLKFQRAKRVKRQVFDFKNGNFDDLRESLTRVPFELAFSDDINEHWSNWKDLFLTAVIDHIPVKTIHDTNSPPWIDGEVRHLIRKKYAALKKFRQNKTPERKQKLRILSQNIKYVIRAN